MKLAGGFPHLVQHFESAVYALRSTAGGTPPGAKVPYDGIGLLTLPHLAPALAVTQDPDAVATMQPDELRVFSASITAKSLFATAESASFQADDTVPAAGLVTFGVRRPDVEMEPFHRSWVDYVRSVAAGSPGLVRAVHNRVVPAPWPTALSFDAVSELWFDTREALLEHLAGDPLPYPAVDAGRSVTVPTTVLSWWRGP